jgi:hypothetical protein
MASLAANALVHDRYRVIQIIGHGGMGAVYEALDTRLGTQVALKQLTIEGAEVEQAFWREAHLLSGLRHPGLPRVIDYFQAGVDRFLVMDYIEGEDLLAYVRRRRVPIAHTLVLEWTEQVLDVLVYLHGRTPPILHRDLKPANLKLTDGGRIVVLDFGLAKGTLTLLTAGPQTTPSLFAASPQYAPLEQLRGTGTSNRSDLYSLGATMFHLLGGAAPPGALDRSAEIVEGRVDPLDSWDPLSGIPESVKNIVRTAMRLNVAERYGSAAEMLNAVRSIGTAPVAPAPAPVGAGPAMTAPDTAIDNADATQRVDPARPIGRPTPSPDEKPRRTVLIGIGCALLLIVLLLSVPRLLSRLLNPTGDPAGPGTTVPREFVVPLDALIGPGAPADDAGRVDAAGATQAYLFDLASAERVYVRTIAYDSGMGGLRLQLIDPGMREIISTCLACGDLGVQTLATPGRYRVIVGGNEPATGSYQLGINRVPPAQDCTVVRPAQPGGASVTVDPTPGALGAGCGVIAVPGDTDVYLLSMRAGESLRVARLSLDPGAEGADVVLADESGAVLTSGLLETLPLVASIARDGMFRLRVGSERSPATGGYALQFTFSRD